MSRYARRQSATGIYHIMLRGNEKKDIYFDDEDRSRFIDTLRRMKEKGEFRLYAYCLMTNHVHLLIGEGSENIHRSMKRICVSYVHYFNKKYKRVGHLFQDRFRSEAVEIDEYILAAARYIHNNPVKAGITQYASDYIWSSYNEYLKMGKVNNSLLDRELLLGMLSDTKNKAVELMKEYTEQVVESGFIDIKEQEDPAEKINKRILNSTDEINAWLEKQDLTLQQLKELKDRKIRNELLREIKEQTDVSIRDLSNILGISKDIIFRA